MKITTALWLCGVVIGWAGLAFLTPERIGERAWSLVRVPVVLFLAASWFGFFLAVIAQATLANRGLPSDVPEVDLSAAASADETLVASARRGTKLAVFLLGLLCAMLAVWDGLIRTPTERLGTAIWTAAAGALAGYLYKLVRCSVVFAPSGISGHEYDRTVAKTYAEVADFRVLSRSRVQILFSDGESLTVSSDMADLRRVLATVTARRLS